MDNESIRSKTLWVSSVAFLAGVFAPAALADSIEPLPEPTEVVVAANERGGTFPIVSSAEGDDTNGPAKGGAAVRDALREMPNPKAKKPSDRNPATAKRVPVPGDRPVPGAPPAPVRPDRGAPNSPLSRPDDPTVIQ
jgi:hypothetical protein